MSHPYIDLEETSLWRVVDAAIKDLVDNGDLVERTAHAHIVGYLCREVIKEREMPKAAS